jgi:ABC-type glutathione transport system ATPase component
LLICDEPTTALDVTIQAQILKLIKQLQKNRDVAVIFISHDLGVVAGIADKVLVMCEGKTQEQNTTREVFYNSTSVYTKKLLSAIPKGAKAQASGAQQGSPLVEVNRLKTYFKDFSKTGDKSVKAVDDVSLSIQKGEIFGLVGESGSGKSTLGRSILQLAPTMAGSVVYSGTDLCALESSKLLALRPKLQMIFQDPYASLNPRMTVYETLAEPLLYHRLATKQTVGKQVQQLMDDVGLDRSSALKYPHEFSGGQRQRIAIGRAIATQPEFIVADEPVSALDVTIQAQILELILSLVEQRNLTMLFISHDLSVVRSICDRVAVMQQGKLVELGETEKLWAKPDMPYTQELLQAIPSATPKN